VEPDVVKKLFVIAEQGRRVPRTLFREADVIDVDDPQPLAPEIGHQTEVPVHRGVEEEGHFPDGFAPVEDLGVVDDPVLPDQKHILAVLEFLKFRRNQLEKIGGGYEIAE
jgi:hypothetical protein